MKPNDFIPNINDYALKAKSCGDTASIEALYTINILTIQTKKIRTLILFTVTGKLPTFAFDACLEMYYNHPGTRVCISLNSDRRIVLH